MDHTTYAHLYPISSQKMLTTISIAFGKPNPDGACVDMLVFLAGMEINIESPLAKSDFLSGRAFGQGVIVAEQSVTVRQTATSLLKKKFVPLRPITSNVNNNNQQLNVNSSSKVIVPLEPVSLLGKEASTSTPDSCWSAHW